MTDDTALPVAGLGRRLAAMFYDALLLIALWAVTTACFLPFTGGEFVESGGPVLTNIYRAVLLAVWVLFYGVFWTRSGQTLGMAAWRMRLVRDDGKAVRWREVLLRLAGGVLSLAPAGLGFLWLWFDRERLTWHDHLSHTRPLVLPKQKKGGTAT